MVHKNQSRNQSRNDFMDSRKSNFNGIKRYREFCSLHGLKQLIQELTRITEKTESLLDQIISNSSQKVSQHGVLNIGLSDHQMIYCRPTRKSTRVKNHDHKNFKICSTKNYSIGRFLKKLKFLEFPNHFEFIDINAAYSHFLRLITSVIDEIAPIKEIRVRSNTQEWLDKEVLERSEFETSCFTNLKGKKPIQTMLFSEKPEITSCHL